MRAQDDDGVKLNAEFSVKTDGLHLSLVLESAGGRTSASGRTRNDQYVPALRLLLTRLRDRQAVLLAALVASARVSALPESERALVQGPVDLADVDDIERLRLDITRAQGRIGLPTGAAKEGNNRKRILLRLAVPGYGPRDAARLEGDLAASARRSARPLTSETLLEQVGLNGERLVLPDARNLLRSLVGMEINTATGTPNTVLGMDDDTILVRTDCSPTAQPVGIGDVQQGLDLLAAHRSVRVGVDELGHSCSFIGAVLATLPNAQFTKNPTTVSLHTPTSTQVAQDPHFGALDSVAQVKTRKEQAQLRKLLAGERQLAECALCGHEYPMEFLVAAHVKKRAVCNDAERGDLHHVAMLACSFGCDALYESGWITVDENGRVFTAPLDGVPEGMFRDSLLRLTGLRCAAHCQASEPYFAWHRKTVFRSGSDRR